MLLIKDTLTEYGVSADIWRVGLCTFDTIRKEGSYSLMLFITMDAENFVATETISLNELIDKTRYDTIFNHPEGIIAGCINDAITNVDMFTGGELRKEVYDEPSNSEIQTKDSE